MEVTSNKPFLIKKCTEIINGISAVNGAVPVIGAVPYNDYTIENANNEKCIGITVLLAIPVIGDLVRLKEKLYIHKFWPGNPGRNKCVKKSILYEFIAWNVLWQCKNRSRRVI